MFWSAVLGGLGLFLKWRIWVLLGGVVLCQFAARALYGWASMTHTDEGAGCFGMIWTLVADWVFSAILVALAILIACPILLFGYDDFLPLDIVGDSLGDVIKSGLLAGGMVTLLGCVPLVGDLLRAANASLSIEGILVYRMLLSAFVGNPAVSLPAGSIPSLWATIGFMFLGLVTQMGAAAALSIKQIREDAAPSLGAQLATAILAFAPIFMYTEHVRLMVTRR